MRVKQLSTALLLYLADTVLVLAYTRLKWTLNRQLGAYLYECKFGSGMLRSTSEPTMSLIEHATDTDNKKSVLDSGHCGKQSQRSIANFSFVRRTLMRYKELHGDMLVPRRFTVPDQTDKWPEDMWSMKLGDVVNNIRRGLSYVDRREELSSIGFCYAAAQSRYKTTKAALLQYRKENGDMLVPRRFIVPRSDEWPEETWNMRLGDVVYNIRRGVNYLDKREDLVNIGFHFESHRSYEAELVIQALLKFKKINGNYVVPAHFIVPEGRKNGNWSKKMWGMELGQVVVNIRCGIYSEWREELRHRGIIFDTAELKFNKAKTALVNFKKINGHMMVPTRFVVPSNNHNWPRDTWGLKLGGVVSKIRGGDYSDKQEELLRIGFCYDIFLAKYNLSKLALLSYQEIYGHMLVPQRFTVPHNNQKWPEKTWGMKLGTLVDSVRRGLSYADRREELSAMGFNFEQQTQSTYSFETVYAALCRFNELKGHMLVPRSYCVPSSSHWPEETWGMRLGTHVNSIRNGRSYVDKRSELLNIGFIYDARKSHDIQNSNSRNSSSSINSNSYNSNSSSSNSSNSSNSSSYNSSSSKDQAMHLASQADR